MLRLAVFGGWCFAAGWYVRATGLDEEIGHAAIQAWNQAVRHTARIAADAAGLRPAVPGPARPEAVA